MWSCAGIPSDLHHRARGRHCDSRHLRERRFREHPDVVRRIRLHQGVTVRRGATVPCLDEQSSGDRWPVRVRYRRRASGDVHPGAAGSVDRSDSGGVRGAAGWADRLTTSGGRVEPSAPRALGRMVVGPSGDGLREGAGLGGATRERTTWVRAGSTAGAGVLGAGSACVRTAAGSAGAGAAATGVGAGATSAGAGAGEIGGRRLNGLGRLGGLICLGGRPRVPRDGVRPRPRDAECGPPGRLRSTPTGWRRRYLVFQRVRATPCSSSRVPWRARALEFSLEPKRSLTSRPRTFGGHSFLFFHNYGLFPTARSRTTAMSASLTLA